MRGLGRMARGALAILWALGAAGAAQAGVVQVRHGGTGLTPLLYAINRGSREVAWMLIVGGARLEQADRNGMTPMDLASALDRRSLVVLLAQFGAKR